MNSTSPTILPGLLCDTMSLDHLSLLAADVEAFAVAVETGPAEAPVAGCPGWDLAALGQHLGDIHRWVIGALITGGPPPPHDDPAPESRSARAAWVRSGGARMIDMIAAIDPDAPTWHPFPVEPKVAGLWRRRQAQEASVHRWDAERAIGGSPTIETSFAADGVDEYWTVMLPRLLARERRAPPTSTLAVELTDVGQRWVVDGSTGVPILLASNHDAAATLRAPAVAMLLRLWGRPTDGVVVAVTGDQVIADTWLALGGA